MEGACTKSLGMVVARIFLPYREKSVPNLCGSGVNEWFFVFGEPVSGRFDQRYAMGSKKCTGSDFILAGSDGIGFEFIANGVLGSLLSSSLG